MTMYAITQAVVQYLSGLGYTVTVDPYAETAPPFLLVECEKSAGTEFVHDLSWSTVTHSLTITAIVNAQNSDYTTYKQDVSDTVDDILGHLAEISNVGVKPIDVTYDELMLGSLRCSGAVISCEVYSVFGETMANGTATLPTATSIGSGSKFTDAAQTAEALSSSTAIRRVHITAHETNTDVVVLGGDNIVAGDSEDTNKERVGYVLMPGGQISVSIDDLAKLYISSVIQGEGVTFTYEA